MNPHYGIILWLVIGALAGWASSALVGIHHRQGALMNLLVGCGGAVLGGLLLRFFFNDYAGDNGLVASFGVALFGSCLLLAVLRLFFSGRAYAR